MGTFPVIASQAKRSMAPQAEHGLLIASLLAAVTEAWTDDGARVRSAAGQIAARLADKAALALPPSGLDAQALDQAAALLVQESDPAHPRVTAVAEDEVDDPVLAAERHRAHGALGGEHAQLLAAAAGQHQRHRFRRHACVRERHRATQRHEDMQAATARCLDPRGETAGREKVA